MQGRVAAPFAPADSRGPPPCGSVAALSGSHGRVSKARQEVGTPLCRFATHEVYDYLRTSELYTLDQALQLVAQHRIADAAAFLRVRARVMPGAMAPTLETLSDALNSLAAHVDREGWG